MSYTTIKSNSEGSVNPERHYNMRELICNLRDAIVLISGQHIGNGFFIKGHYIICPAQLVLNATKILVDISNVNGSGYSYSYEADVIGLDGAANIAILRINMEHFWNTTNPPIRICHPVLQWGKSRNSCPGDLIILIGGTNINTSTGNTVALGNISDNRYTFPTGQIPGELLLLSNILPVGSQSGLPVITTLGTVIGMIISSPSNQACNIALSEFFMRRPVKALIRSFQDNAIPTSYKGFVEAIDKHYRFNKSWLGLAGMLMTQDDYRVTEPKCKEIIGYRISAVTITSPLQDIIHIGDIITHINTCPLGNRKGQISPSLVMWRVRPGDGVTVTYKKHADHFESECEVKITTLPYDLSLDVPCYITNKDTTLPILL